VDSRNEFRYAMSGDLAIAYATYGEGPQDIVFAHGFAGNIEIEREWRYPRTFHDRVASFSRFILFDRRGTGLSDRPREPATLEARMDDVRAVLDAAGSERAVLFGTVEAAAMCVLFAATYPERTLGLILYGAYAKGTWAPEYPWAPTLDEHRLPAAPVMSMVDTLTHPYFKARQTVRTVPDPMLGEVTIPGFPLKFSAYPDLPDIVAPLLGEPPETAARR